MAIDRNFVLEVLASSREAWIARRQSYVNDDQNSAMFVVAEQRIYSLKLLIDAISDDDLLEQLHEEDLAQQAEIAKWHSNDVSDVMQPVEIHDAPMPGDAESEA